MAIVSAPVDYTDKDLASLRERLYALTESAFPEWTDHNVANFGNVLVELYAFVGDMLSFYQDRQAAESRITTATQRRSLIALAKLLGFAPSGATAATADVLLAIAAVTAGDVLVPAGTVAKTADVTTPVEFQLLEDVTILTGATSAPGTVENSESVEDTFSSSRAPNQEIVLAQTPYLDGGTVLAAADGAYTEAANFLSSTATDRHYVVTVDQNDRARVRFGNGVTGSIPVGTITVSYKVGGGAKGRVPAGAIKVLDGAFADAFGTSVQLTVTNPAASAGGTDRMTNAAIRVRAPASVRAPVNSVAREDFEINALRLSGVARALMVSSDEDVTVPENEGNLYIIPTGGGVSSLALRAEVLDQVTVVYPAPLTFVVNVLDAIYVTVNIEARVYRRAGYSRASVRANIEGVLAAWFAIEDEDGGPNANVDFGANYRNADGDPDPRLPWSDIFNAVRDTLGVRKIDASAIGFLLNGERDDVMLLSAQFPQLGALTLIDADASVAF